MLHHSAMSERAIGNPIFHRSITSYYNFVKYEQHYLNFRELRIEAQQHEPSISLDEQRYIQH